jgi:hypothetical protein
MAMRILTGVLNTKERNGRATIHFNPHKVTGDATGGDMEETGASGDFRSRPGKVVSMREFVVEDRTRGAGGSEKDLFRISDTTPTNDHMEVNWSCESGARIKEMSYLIVGDA